MTAHTDRLAQAAAAYRKVEADADAAVRSFFGNP